MSMGRTMRKDSEGIYTGFWQWITTEWHFIFFGVGPLLAYLFYYMFTDEVEKGEIK